MATQIKLRRDTDTNWTANSTVVLGEGEIGVNLTNGQFKLGDGTSTWAELVYFHPGSGSSIDLNAITSSILPATDNTYDLGSPSYRWRHVYAAEGSIYIGDIKLSNNAGQLVVQQVTDAGQVTEAPVPNTPGVVTTDRLINGAHSFLIGADGSLSLDGSPFTGGGATYDQPLNTTDSVTFNEITSTALWQTNAKTVSPARTLVPGATPTVVFAAPNWFTSFKLVIAVEGRLDGDGTNVDHTQTCEATIAATYNTATEPIMSVYGIVYTSPTPLATFTVARNGSNIEVTAVNSQTTNDLDVRVQAIQFVSRYD